MKKPFLLLLIISFAIKTFSQNQEKITYQEIKSQCSSIPLSQRARLSVTRFSVTTSSINDERNQHAANAKNSLKALSLLKGGGGNAPRADVIPVTLGDNLTTMLTNALQGVSCFRVLETLKNNNDLTSEIDAGDSKYSSKKAPKAGNQLGAQIVATGEVIEYSDKAKGLSVMGVGVNKKIVKIGFNLKLINPQTRDIIVSKVIRVQSKTNNSVDVGGLFSTENSDPAVAAVMEDGVIQAVQYIAHVRDSLNITVDNIPGNNIKSANGEKEIEISLSNASFASFNGVTSIINTLPGYISMEKSFSSGIGTYTVVYKGSPDDLLTALNNRLGSKYEITGFTPDKIDIKTK